MSFFEDRGGEPVDYPAPSRVYARVDASAEESDDGLTRLECVDADWLDGMGREFPFTGVKHRGLLTDPEVDGDAGSRVSLLFWEGGAGSEGDILELHLEDQPGNVQHFLNLTGPPLERQVAILRWPDREEAREIARATAMGDEIATDEEVREALLAAPYVDAVAVYDVGQGAFSALIADDEPRLYFDLGAGSATNRHTRPHDLNTLCPHVTTVVLSHWHFDHWSLAEAAGTELLAATWIVPHQSLGFASATLLGLIRRHGTALVRSPGAPTLYEGPISLHACTGTNLNDSGLALVVRDRGGERPVALPGDARYKFITDLPRDVHALVAAHHGGRTNAAVKEIPRPEGAGSVRPDPASVLVYSFGSQNSYRHPLPTPVERHEEAGWASYRDLRTADAHPVPPIDHCHIHIYWDAAAPDVGTPCARLGLPTRCDLGPCRR